VHIRLFFPFSLQIRHPSTSFPATNSALTCQLHSLSTWPSLPHRSPSFSLEKGSFLLPLPLQRIFLPRAIHTILSPDGTVIFTPLQSFGPLVVRGASLPFPIFSIDAAAETLTRLERCTDNFPRGFYVVPLLGFPRPRRPPQGRHFFPHPSPFEPETFLSPGLPHGDPPSPLFWQPLLEAVNLAYPLLAPQDFLYSEVLRRFRFSPRSNFPFTINRRDLPQVLAFRQT